MTTLALALFLAADGYTDALLWPRFRRWGWGNRWYQLVRFVIVRAPLLAGAMWLAPGGWLDPWGVLTGALCLLLVWAAPMDTLYHAFGAEDHRGHGRFGIPLSTLAHDHKGPILPAIASDMIGVARMSEVEYRTASVAAGLAILLCAACIDAVLLLLA